MKKITIIVSSFIFFICMVVGCGCKKETTNSKIMGKGVKDIETYVKLTSVEELEAKIENDDSFILYIYDVMCGNCTYFSEEILIPFIQEKDIEIFAVESSLAGLNDVIRVKSTPTMVIYEDGLIISKEEGTKSFTDESKFNSYINKYVYMPNTFYVTKVQMDALKTSNEKFFLYFESATCGDCSKFHSEVLEKYMKKADMIVKFYIYEVDEIRKSSEAGVWQTFKDQYGLSNAINPKGYGVGYVPTIQYISNGSIVDMMVVFNDTGKVDNEDGTFTYTTSYYEDSPALTLHFKDYDDYRNRTIEFYSQKFDELISDYNK